VGVVTRKRRTGEERAVYLTNMAARLSSTGGRCELRLPRVCTGLATGVHHVYPQRHGRDDSYGNLRAACWPCNTQVEQMGVRTAAELGLYSATPIGGE
jgi:5-methylcytosine-specific restriction endonuclease McrA